jgi:hypothetical protein
VLANKDNTNYLTLTFLVFWWAGLQNYVIDHFIVHQSVHHGMI